MYNRAARPALTSGGWGGTDTVALCALVVLGFVLRVGSLRPRSLYRDDAWQAIATRAHGWGQLFRVGVTAPGFAFLLRGWSSVVGFSELRLQLPAFVAGVLGGPAVYFMGRRFRLSRAGAMIAGAFIVAALPAVQYAARVKPYTADVLVAVALLILARRLTLHPRSGRAWAVLAALAVAALVFSASTAPIAVSSMLVAGVVAVKESRTARHQLVPAAIAIGTYLACAMVWYLAVLRATSNSALLQFWSQELVHLSQGPNASAHATARIVRMFAENSTPVSSPAARAWVSRIVGLAVIAGLVRLLRSREIATAGLLVGPLVIALALAIAGKVPLGGGRTDIYLYPCVALLAGGAADLLLDVNRHRSALANRGIYALSLVASISLVVAAVGDLRSTYPREDVKQLVALVDTQAEPGDRIVVYPETSYLWALYRPRSVRIVPDDVSMTGWTPRVADPRVLLLKGYQFDISHCYVDACAQSIREVDELIAHQPTGGRLWLLLSTYYPTGHLVALDAELHHAGYQVVATYQQTKAIAQVWARS